MKLCTWDLGGGTGWQTREFTDCDQENDFPGSVGKPSNTNQFKAVSSTCSYTGSSALQVVLLIVSQTEWILPPTYLGNAVFKDAYQNSQTGTRAAGTKA